MEFFMDIITKFTLPGIVFLVTLAFGVWLSKLGKPYNGILFNIHKLMALGAVVTATMQVYKIFTVAKASTLVIVLVVLVVLCVVSLFATGAFMSVGKFKYEIILAIHRILPILATISAVAIIYLLVGKNI
jgi:hypothetical protein